MFNYIVVQAGGKGTRLEYLTANKPKAIVPVENLPMLFHLFRKYPEKKFIIIADYKKEVLTAYLKCFAQIQYIVVDAEGTGTCSGLKKALELIPSDESFLLIWSDLILSEGFQIPEESKNYIGISQTFQCRWKHAAGIFTEEQSVEDGVAGLFLFENKKKLINVPESGEFVRWLKDQNLDFEPLGLAGTREFGTLREYEKLQEVKTRPFNKMTFSKDTVVKEPLDAQGYDLAKGEKAWYKFAVENGIMMVPIIKNYEPLIMERVNGVNIYEVDANEEVLTKIIKALKALHGVRIVETDFTSLKEAYFGKTIKRLDKIRDLVPFADRKLININGRMCKNIYFYKHDFEKLLERIKCDNFNFIHGDCTFSNILLRENGDPVFIDPRGYFGYTDLFGDPNYDWAKLYYSIVGNYDQFNLNNFKLTIKNEEVLLSIQSNNWDKYENLFFSLTGADEFTIKLIHSLIWLSLTTYTWQNYDSVCGAFYNGLYYLEECWNE